MPHTKIALVYTPKYCMPNTNMLASWHSCRSCATHVATIKKKPCQRVMSLALKTCVISHVKKSYHICHSQRSHVTKFTHTPRIDACGGGMRASVHICGKNLCLSNLFLKTQYFIRKIAKITYKKKR